jgi:uncharacterized protein (TIGR03067 family)
MAAVRFHVALAFCLSAVAFPAEAGSAKPKETFRVTPGLAAAVFSGDGRWLAVAGGQLHRSGTVSLWEARTGKARFALAGHGDLVLALAFSPDGKTLASAGWDRCVRLWDVGTGNKLATLWGHTRQVWSLAFSPDGKLLASGSADRTAVLWDVAAGREKATARGRPASALGFSPDGRTLAVGGDDGTVGLWDVAKGREFATLKGHTNRVVAVAFAPDGKTLATGSWDTTVKIWEPAKGRLKATLVGHRGSLVSLAYSPDGQLLASACRYHRIFREGGAGGEIANIEEGNEVRLWATGPGKLRRSFDTGERPGLVAVGFSPDGKILTTVNVDGTVKRWDPARLAGPETPDVPRSRGRPTRKAGEDGWSAASQVPDGGPARLERLVQDLDSNSFRTRERAQRQLSKAGPGAVPLLETEIAAATSPEVRSRLARVLDRLRPEADHRGGELAARFAKVLSGSARDQRKVWEWFVNLPEDDRRLLLRSLPKVPDRWLREALGPIFKYLNRLEKDPEKLRQFRRNLGPIFEYYERLEKISKGQVSVEAQRLGAAAGPAGGKERGAKEGGGKMLDGQWETVNVEKEGNELGGGFRGFRMVVKGKTFDVVNEEGERVGGGTIKLDPGKEPPAVDLTYTAGAGKGTTRLGLYRLQGDTLTIALAEAGEARPRRVESEPGSVVTLYEYRRKTD